MSAPDDQQAIEQLSDLMDGELDATQARFLLRRMDHDQSLRARWARWHGLRAALSQPLTAGPGFAAGIAAVIEAEPAPEAGAEQSKVPQSGRADKTTAFLKPLAGLGVAAAVAAVAINLAQTGPGNNGGPIESESGLSAAQRSALISVPVEQVADATPVRPVENSARAASSGFTQALDPRLQEYLLRHNQVSVTRRGQSLVPYIYVSSANSGPDGETTNEPSSNQSSNTPGSSSPADPDRSAPDLIEASRQ